MLSLIVLAAVALFPILITVAALYDVLTMTIPNEVSLILIAGFAVAALAAGLGLETIGLHVAVGAGILAVTFTLFAFGIIGGGDAKLAAVMGLWLGPEQMSPFLIYTALFGGALSLGILFFRKLPLPAFAARQPWVMRLHDPQEGVPYGVALAIGAMLVFPESPLFLALAT